MLSRVTLALSRPCGISRVSRSFSDVPSSSSVASTAAESIENPVGRYYHDLVHRGRGHNALALGDLRKLLQMCNTPELARFGLHAVDLYQRKGQDFSEEVNSHFIRSVAVEGERAVSAAKVIAKWKNRIGAWGTTTSLQKLLQGLLDQGSPEEAVGDSEVNVAELAVTVLEVSQKKGVGLTKPNFEVAMKLIAEVEVEVEDEAPVAAAGEGEGGEVGESEGQEGEATEEKGASAAPDGPELRARLQHVAVMALGEEEASSLAL